MSEFPQNSSPDDKPRLVVVVPVILVCLDRKSTRLNSSHLVISYAVFCLKKKNNHNITTSKEHYITTPRTSLPLSSLFSTRFSSQSIDLKGHRRLCARSWL